MTSDPLANLLRVGLRKQRNLCDYDGDLVTSAMLDECVQQARQLLQLAQEKLKLGP
jgi:hypothetical protein